MSPDLNDLATSLYVTIDDLLTARPELCPQRPAIGMAPRLSDAELVTVAVIQALLGYHNEAQFIRFATTNPDMAAMFPFIPQRSGYHRRLKHATTMMTAITRALAQTCQSWTDDLWLADSTPVECGRSRETTKRSDLVGYATYGYCASHSRFFWGCRLHLVVTPSGLPIAWALAPANADERVILRDLLEIDEQLLQNRPHQTLITDKGYQSKELETFLNEHGATLIRPATKRERTRPGARFLKTFRQIVESVNQMTLKAQLDLERHGARKIDGLRARTVQRLLALTAAIWHNEHTNQPTLRSHTAFDH